MKEYIFLLTHQRAGSHFLGFCIDSHPDVAYVDELTRITSKDRLKKELRTEKKLIQFLEKHFGNRKEPKILIDVKYNHVLKSIEKLMEKSKVIHLYRESKLDTYYSALHAEYRRKYRLAEYKKGGEVTDKIKKPKEFPTFMVKEDVLNYLIKTEFVVEKKFGHLVGLTFTYEELTGKKNVNQLDDKIMKEICQFLEIKEHPLKAKTIKMSPSNIKPYLKDL